MMKLLVLDTGAYDNDPIYKAILGLPVDDITICHDTKTPHAKKRVENAANRLNVPLHSVDELDTILQQERFPGRILILIQPTAAKDYVVNLMRHISEFHQICENPISIMIHPPSGISLLDTIELLAYSRLYGIPIWISVSRRYARGVRYLYQLVPHIAPLTQMNATLHSGFYGSSGFAALMRDVVFHHADLLCYLAKRSNNSEIPISLSAEHSSIYQDAIAVSLAFDSGLVACLSTSANHKGNFGFHEHCDVTGAGSAVELKKSLEHCQYINLTQTDEFRIGLAPNIEMTLDEPLKMLKSGTSPNQDQTPDTQSHLTDLLKAFSTEDETTELTRLQLMLLDFIQTTAPDTFATQYTSSTLRSCLPGIWTLDAIQQSINDKARIARSERHDIKLKKEISEIKKSTPHSAAYQRRALSAARQGHLDFAIDLCVLGIMQNDEQIRQGWYTPRFKQTLPHPTHPITLARDRDIPPPMSLPMHPRELLLALQERNPYLSDPKLPPNEANLYVRSTI